MTRGTTARPADVSRALDLLREARELLDGCPRAQDRVRLAITSTGGALRNARSQERGRRAAANQRQLAMGATA